MRGKKDFVDEVSRLAPDIGDLGRLYDGFQAAAPQVPEDLPRSETAERVLARVMDDAPEALSLGRALLLEVRAMPVATIWLAMGFTLGLVLAETLAPPIALRGETLAWVALAAPWLGMLWGIAVVPTDDGAWADWRAMAPVSQELLLVGRLGLAGLVSLVVAAVLPFVGGARALPAGIAVLSWMGPFALGLALMVFLLWRWNTVTAFTVSTIVWGLPVVAALAASGQTVGGPVKLLTYPFATTGSALIPIDALMLAAACVLIIWLVRRGSAWTLN